MSAGRGAAGRIRARLAAALLAVGLAGAGPPAAATMLPVTLDTETLTEDEARRADALLQQADALLPTAVQAHLPALRLRFVDDLPDHIQGRLRGRDLRLPRGLLRSPDPAVALPALLHELAHALDRRARLSRDPRLLDLAGWQYRPRRFGLRNARNPMRDRSPDPYELHSPAEFVAVNLEHFLLDPAYRCRRPALHRHFAAALGIPGAGDDTRPECDPSLPFVMPDADGTPLDGLTPDRVVAVEYLFAEPTDAIMSRWGHSMLRLVVCAPGRPPGPECRFDLEHHRVLSFRAFVDDVQLSNWRGLTGRYPSRLFVLPLSQVVDEYTRTELRGLRSVPLRLDANEIAGLVERAAQLHWSYDGRYTFLGNNCASETFKLLHDGVPRLADERLAAITPTGLLRKLERRGIADASVLDDPAEAARLGYRFPAASDHYRMLFAVADAALHLPAADVVAWLDLDAAARRPWLTSSDLRATAALMVLEDAALRRVELRARDAFKRRLLRADAADHDVAALLEGVLAAEGVLIRPAALLAEIPGYGLPQAEERAAAGARARALQAGREQDGLHLVADAEQALPAALRDELVAQRVNVDTVSAHLRACTAADVAASGGEAAGSIATESTGDATVRAAAACGSGSISRGEP